MSERVFAPRVLERRVRPGPELAAARPLAPPEPSAPALTHAILRAQRAIGNHVVRRALDSRPPSRGHLMVSSPDDPREREAERVAERVLRGGVAGGARALALGPAPATSQSAFAPRSTGPDAQVSGRPPAAADVVLRVAEGARPHPGAGAGPVRSAGVERGVRSMRGGGRPLPPSLRAFFEPRFGRDFSDVRVHTDRRAAESASSVSALAYTLGRDVVFAQGRYAPGTREGRRLIAHELTHVVQQDRSGSGPPTLLQRTVHEGNDHGGRYEFDDRACTFTYYQNWFFTFQTDQTAEEREAYMEAARTQIRDVWSQRFPLIPDRDACACHPDGVTVHVVVRTHARDRQGSRGFTVVVSDEEERGFAHQPNRQVDLGTAHDVPVSTGVEGGQRRIAHEFGHTIGLTDEYHGWAGLFDTEGSRDEPSIMHSGDAVRPRHYQHFADLLTFEMGGTCTYLPNGVRLPQYENPVNRFTGIPFSFLPPTSQSLIGLQFDRRLSNEAIFGLLYPTAGLMTIYDPARASFDVGPTVGLRLNQLAHPLFVDVRTGLLFDPENPATALDLRLPISASVGLRGAGYELGIGYTAIANVLGEGGWTHLVGVGLEVQLPAWLR